MGRRGKEIQVAKQEKRTSIGGQALIEGILMRGPFKQAIAVRDQAGKVVLTTEDLKFIKDRYPVLGLPLIRGHGGGRQGADVLRLLLSGGGNGGTGPV